MQKGGLWKRVAAWLFDSILLSVLIVGIAVVLSGLLGYDQYNAELNTAYTKYESQYGVIFEISEETYLSFSDAQRMAYDNAYRALTEDDAAMHAYTMTISLTLLIATMSTFLGILGMEFVVPLIFGNGQTLGKKIFSLCLVRSDGVRINAMQLFARSVLGKFTLEMMLPLYVAFMIFWGYIGLIGTMFLFGLCLVQVILLCVTRNNLLLHDLLAGTVVADFTSQQIFCDTQELIEYTKKIHAERAARQGY